VYPAQTAGLLKSRGLALLAKREARAAIKPLEQALELMSASSGKTADPRKYAEVEWALARALRAAGRDYERARTLAESAQQIFKSLGRAGENAAKAIDAWLASEP
jgi:hypothetical protein